VDNGTLQVYQYTAAADRTSGSQIAGATFALAPGDTNPVGIADPPAPGTALTKGHGLMAETVPPAVRQLPDTFTTPSLAVPGQLPEATAAPPAFAALTATQGPAVGTAAETAPLVAQVGPVTLAPASALKERSGPQNDALAQGVSRSPSRARSLAVTDRLFSEDPLPPDALSETAFVPLL
jgi:hypothetical protein